MEWWVRVLPVERAVRDWGEKRVRQGGQVWGGGEVEVEVGVRILG